MNKKEVLVKIKELQEQIRSCPDNLQALMLQKQLVDLLTETLQNKDFQKAIINIKNQAKV